MIYTSHEELIQKLKGLGFLQSNAVEEAFARINRIHFVNRGVTLNAPFMHAMCLELLRTRLQQGNRALDVGAGSGYLSACMAHMVGPDGDVFGIDSDWNVVESATRNMMNFKVTKHYLQHGLLTLKVGDGREGLPTKAPFDAIHVGVAVEAIPPALVKQLRPGGMMVLPLINDINNKKSLQTLTVIVRKPATANSESRDMPEFDTFPVLQVNYSLMSRSPNAGQQNSKS